MRPKIRVGLSIIVTLAIALIGFSIIARGLAPHDPLETDFGHMLQPPSDTYPFGTDQVGRCVLSRILASIRISLGMTFALLSMIFLLGVTIGIVAGMYGGVVDTLLMRLADTVLAFPSLVFAIAIVGILGPGMKNTLLALAMIWWTKYAKLTRVLVMGVKHHVYMDAAIMAGASKFKRVIYYVVPNIFSQLVIQLSLDVSGMMLSLAGMSFLGLGVQPPTPELGVMLSEGRAYMQVAPWLVIYPGFAIFVIVAVFNVLGDSVRDALDPKQIL
jgi:peptide/nickel transport system permease protein